MKTQRRTTGYLHAQQLLSMVIAGIILSFVLYSYAIASTTLSISDAKNTNSEITELQTEIAELELEYYQMINAISLTQAEELGFDETKEVHYATINPTTNVAYNL